MLITRRHGSWVVLGTVVTDVEIEPSPPLQLDCGDWAITQYLRTRGVELAVLDDPECVRLMRDFIRAHTDLWNEDIGG